MQKELLIEYLGKESAEEAIKLSKAYDNYVKRFKIKMNKLLEPTNLEVKVGILYSPKLKGK